ncbi:anti-sigma factor [Nocardia sp. 852002-20019_SCH5090214]|uniref:Anti-sigma factor n=2 Tax=Nocardia TaxID=1817 RepID=A0A2T2Z716_9NOCA|nr:anti-sigma factor [Nocardia nova]MBF6244108.1 anti-sigma factor [Nocardia elegans]OBA44102.1 anti-sigma factor [Nocardia sp. 852002-20019_SCH5090214]OBA55058.1 anti-sigma factor [Nocardia sp. 852002-51101_SCH5132738]OBB49052.1 anti-sigma factor [Nocardia sp. 852002-51244_SCH5132740]OBF83414.1 anti-sigma factor [Mycobacterium sp. 852002-51759_SCH5129042]
MINMSAEEGLRSTPVEIGVAATVSQLPIVRGLAETLVLLSDFTLDEVADIRLAVDEACSTLIELAVPGSTLQCRFTVGDTDLLVRVAGIAATSKLPDQRSFGWHVLRTLTDGIEVAQEPFDSAISGYPTVVEFRRVRGKA